MKLLFIYTFVALLSTMSFALPNDNMADIQSPNEYKKEVFDIATSDYECNLFIEKTGNNLYSMAMAEERNDKKTISSEFYIFLKNSNTAIEYCKYYSESVVSDLLEIQEGVIFYYNKEYNKKKDTK